MVRYRFKGLIGSPAQLGRTACFFEERCLDTSQAPEISKNHLAIH